MAGHQLPPGPHSEGELFRLFTENVKDYALFPLDPAGRVAGWNGGAQRVLGYREEDILGQPFARIFTPEDIADAQPEHELRLAAERGRAEDERWHIRQDGTRIWASGTLTPLWDDAGRLRGFVKILRDISERKRAEDQLAEANQRKDEFLALLSHELRNPLAPIRNAACLIEQEAEKPAVKQAAGIIGRQMRHLVRIVDDLLDISRITRGKVQLQRQRVELRDLVAHAVETTRPLIDSRKHALAVALPAEAVWLDVDPARVEQILANLLNNAAKYTEPGGHIRLTAEREGPQAVVRVKDDGLGIGAEMLPRVFELFVQADRSLDRSQGGLGIGLTLVRRLAEMHGGTVEAFSEGVGHGSEFVVRLPALAEVRGLAPEAIPAPAPRAGRALRVLLVDDNVDTAESLAMILRLAGHEAEVAYSGPKALEAVQARRPDVVLLDIGLPGMSGYEVARHLRRQGRKPAPRLIAMTGYGSDADRQRSQEAGFDFHLVKPVDPARLQELLADLGGV